MGSPPSSVRPEIRKAAVLLMSLPEEQAAQLLGKLEPKQVEAVSIEIAKLGDVSGEEQEAGHPGVRQRQSRRA